jgi:hypothetical protein
MEFEIKMYQSDAVALISKIARALAAQTITAEPVTIDILVGDTFIDIEVPLGRHYTHEDAVGGEIVSESITVDEFDTDDHE